MTTTTTTPTPIEHNIRDAALDYATRDWPVFPVHGIRNGRCSCGKANCDDAGKHPRVSGGFHAATTDPEQINTWWRQWPDANVGIPTGERSGFIVVDLDRREDRDGVATAAATWGHEPKSGVCTRTGSGNSYHCIFQYPGFPVKSEQAIAPGVDVKGDGGYVVGPPSRHISGNAYEWLVHPDDEDIPEAPEWLLEHLRNGQATPGAQSTEQGDGATIPEGERNGTLASIAGSMRARGMSEEGICAALQVENENRCVPPLSAGEVVAIARSIGRYPPQEAKTTKRTRKGENRRATEADKYWAPGPTGRTGFKPVLLGDELMRERVFSHCSLTGEVMHYRDGVWGPLDKGYLHSLVAKALGDEFRTNHADEVYGYLRAKFGDVEGQFEVAPDGYLNFQNGLLRCDDWELIEHTPDVHSFNQLPVTYDPAATAMPCWRQVLADALDTDEDRNLLQEWFGYAMAPHQYAKRGFVFVGPSNTGKSLALRVLSRLIGEANLSAIPIQKLSERFTAAGLFRMLANISADLPASKVEDSSVFKMLTGNDALHGEHKFGECFSFRSAATPMFSCNQLPYTEDRSQAYFDRWVIMRFANVVSKSDQVSDLDSIIWNAEAPAVAAWAVEGLKRLKRRKWQFEETGAVVEMRKEYRKHADSVFAFVSDRCKLAAGEREITDELFDAYKGYCEVEGISRPVARRTFTAKMLNEFELSRCQKARQRALSGIHMLSEYELSHADGEEASDAG